MIFEVKNPKVIDKLFLWCITFYVVYNDVMDVMNAMLKKVEIRQKL